MRSMARPLQGAGGGGSGGGGGFFCTFKLDFYLAASRPAVIISNIISDCF